MDLHKSDMDTNDTNKLKSKATEAEALSKFPFRVRTSAYSFETPETFKLTEVGVIIADTRCIYNWSGIDLSGGTVTDSAGRMTWRMSNFVCQENKGLPADFPVSFVATPLSDKPAYITVKFIGLETQPNDLVIEVYSWDSQGNPAPFMPFYWRCRIPITPTILRQPPIDKKPEIVF